VPAPLASGPGQHFWKNWHHPLKGRGWEEFLAALLKDERARGPPSFGPILRGEVIREGDGEILAELSGRI